MNDFNEMLLEMNEEISDFDILMLEQELVYQENVSKKLILENKSVLTEDAVLLEEAEKGLAEKAKDIAKKMWEAFMKLVDRVKEWFKKNIPTIDKYMNNPENQKMYDIGIKSDEAKNVTVNWVKLNAEKIDITIDSLPNSNEIIKLYKKFLARRSSIERMNSSEFTYNDSKATINARIVEGKEEIKNSVKAISIIYKAFKKGVNLGKKVSSTKSEDVNILDSIIF